MQFTSCQLIINVSYVISVTQVGPKSVPNMTHCLCNHNTFYGSSFFVLPNHVDLSQTAALFATVKQNYVVVVVLSVFFLLYLIIVMWAWYADRRALRTVQSTSTATHSYSSQYLCILVSYSIYTYFIYIQYCEKLFAPHRFLLFQSICHT